MKFILIAIFFAFVCITPTSDCTMLKNGRFVYKTGKKVVNVEFKENQHTEYHNGGKHTIKSTIEWISGCEYYLRVKETNYPNFPFKIGSKLHVKITKIDGKKIFYKSTINGKSWEGKLVKVE